MRSDLKLGTPDCRTRACQLAKSATLGVGRSAGESVTNVHTLSSFNNLTAEESKSIPLVRRSDNITSSPEEITRDAGRAKSDPRVRTFDNNTSSCEGITGDTGSSRADPLVRRFDNNKSSCEGTARAAVSKLHGSDTSEESVCDKHSCVTLSLR
ncbi:hypothetical protein Bbelb_315930 [Branchiostoma belcheri]|nr:hypothetical protein Bbelb_315930 [Branchiostoma belcheri]